MTPTDPHRPDPHSLALLALAVAREQGADEATQTRLGRALLGPDSPTSGPEPAEPVLVLTARSDDEDAEVVCLPGLTLAAGPDWLLRACERLSPEELTLASSLLRLARQHGHEAARSTGESVLFAGAEAPEIGDSTAVGVSEDPDDRRDLAARCPADDVAAAGLPAWDAAAALVPDDGAGTALQACVAAAGHRVRGGLLADLGVLVVPRLRERGLGAYAAAVACERAWLDGLVPTARVPVQAQAAHQTAVAVGLAPVGHVAGLRLT